MINNYIFYNSSVFFTGEEIKTQLQKKLAVIRTIVLTVFTAFAAFFLRSSMFFLPAVITGIAFLATNLKTQFLSKDPLMETFYKIFGSHIKFNQLPETKLKLNPKEPLEDAIYDLKWEDLKYPVSKAKTLDGRIILIVKGLSRNIEEKTCHAKKIFAYVEKFGGDDIEHLVSKNFLSPFFNAFSPITKGSRYSSGFSNNQPYIYHWEVSPSITSDMANELFAQV